MQTVHTDATQINDFNRIAQKYGFEPLEITDEVREENGEHINVEHEQAQHVEIDAHMLNGLLRPTFDIVCPNWNITNDEINALVSVYTPVLDKYNIGQYMESVELNAVLVTVAIFYSRRGKPLKIVKEAQQESEIMGVQK